MSDTDQAHGPRAAPPHQENGAGSDAAAADAAATAQTWDRANDYEFSGTTPASDLVGTLSESSAPDDQQRLFEAELNQDHVLANLEEPDLIYRRHELNINLAMLLASAPPAESIWQGPRREAAGLEGKPWPFTPTEVQQARDTRDAAYARVTRSRDGWQQTLLAEQQTERRVVEKDSDDGGGILSKLTG